MPFGPIEVFRDQMQLSRHLNVDRVLQQLCVGFQETERELLELGIDRDVLAPEIMVEERGRERLDVYCVVAPGEMEFGALGHQDRPVEDSLVV